MLLYDRPCSDNNVSTDCPVPLLLPDIPDMIAWLGDNNVLHTIGGDGARRKQVVMIKQKDIEGMNGGRTDQIMDDSTKSVGQGVTGWIDCSQLVQGLCQTLADK